MTKTGGIIEDKHVGNGNPPGTQRNLHRRHYNTACTVIM